jgi:membrane associated rhomboid family serine protease
MAIELIFIIVVTCIVSYKGFKDLYFFRKYDFNIASIRSGEQIRMFTYGFLHVDFLHLFFNMFVLFMFSPVVIRDMGGTNFLVIYLASLLSGSLLSLQMHKNEPHYRAVGASGAVTGIVYASILLNPFMKMGLLFLPGLEINAYIFGILYLLYSIYGMKSKSDNIGHSAHFGGAIGGFAFTLIKFPIIITEMPFIVLVLALPILILFILAKFGKI